MNINIFSIIIKLSVSVTVVFTIVSAMFLLLNLKKDAKADYLSASNDLTVSSFISRLLSELLIIVYCIVSNDGTVFMIIPNIFKILAFAFMISLIIACVSSFLKSVSNKTRFARINKSYNLVKLHSGWSALLCFIIAYVFS